MDRSSLRAWLAVLLVGSALLFFVGIYLERGVLVPEAAIPTAPSGQPEASAAEGGEEAGHADAAGESAGTAGETSEEHAGEVRPFGIDVEAPLLVGTAIVISLLLAVAVSRTTEPLVAIAIVAFAVMFTFFDVLEVSFQLGVSRTGLALVAAFLAVLHVGIGLIALRLVRQQRAGPLATR